MLLRAIILICPAVLPLGGTAPTPAMAARHSSHAVGNLGAKAGATLSVAHTIVVGPFPSALAVDTQSGRAFVRNGDGTVSVLDVTRGRVLRTVMVVPFEHNNVLRPQGVAVDEQTNRAFIVNETADTVSVLDATSGHVLRIVSVGRMPRAVAVDAQTGRAFVINVGTTDLAHVTAGSVTVLDATTGTVRHTTPVGRWPDAVALDVQAGHAFVVNEGDRTVGILDATTGALVRTVPIRSAGSVGAGVPAALAVDTQRGHIFVGGNGRTITVLNAMSGHVQCTFDITAPLFGQRAYAMGTDWAMAVDQSTGYLIVAWEGLNFRGAVSIVAIARAHPSILHTDAVTYRPRAVVIDSQSGYAFVDHETDVNSTSAPLRAGAALAINVKSGSISTPIPVGWDVGAMALDTRRRQLLVVNQGGGGGNSSSGTVSVLSIGDGGRP